MSTDAERLDDVARKAQAGTADLQELIETFLDSVVVVPSGADIIGGPDAFQPVIVPIDGETLVAVFSSAKAAAIVTDRAPYAATMTGRDVILTLAPGLGLLVGTDNSGFEIAPHLVASIRDYESGADRTT